MEDIDCWEEKFESCIYSDRLLNKLADLNKLVKQPVDIREVKKAIYYARKYHGQQMRKSGEPYYSHPIEVAIMVSEHTAYREIKLFTNDIIITSLLHDTIEDTKLTEENIAIIFNQEIARQVEALTRIKPNEKITSAEMLKLLYHNLERKLLVIKLFDRFHNIQTLKVKTPEKAKKIIDETLEEFLILAEYLKLPDIAQATAKLCKIYY